MKNDVVELLVYEQGQDADGFPVETEYAFGCFADIQSAKRSEYYEASRAGFDVRLVCGVNDDDYDAAKVSANGKPSKVRFDGIVYKILREYRIKTKKSVELTLIEGE